MDLFLSSVTMTTLTHTAGYTPLVNDQINVAGAWSPYHQIPELAFSTPASSNHYYTTISRGNAPLATPVFTTSQLNVPTLPQNVAGYYIEIENVTISGGGAFSTFFPNYGGGNVSYTLTDASGSMVMYDWVTSYSVDGNLGYTAVPTGPTNLFGFVTVYPGAGDLGQFTPVMSTIPEPSSIMLLGAGLLGLLAIRRRRS
jgi:hypothetical protein